MDRYDPEGIKCLKHNVSMTDFDPERIVCDAY